MIVISDAVIAARGVDYVADLPIVLYDNLVSVSNIAATYEDSDYPVTNLANAATELLWKSGDTSDGYLTITLDGTIAINAMGVARHNWGSGLVVASVEGDTGSGFVEIVAEQQLGDDSPALFVFESDYYTSIRFKLQPDAVEPQAAVVYAGAALTFPRSVPIGHKPLKYSRNRQLLNVQAMSGDFLGNITLSQNLSSNFDVKLLDGTWWWTYGQPFIDVCREPFFLAWRPDTRPLDVAYAWATNDPQPIISQITGEVDISLSLGGLAL